MITYSHLNVSGAAGSPQIFKAANGLKPGFDGFHFGPLEPENNEIWDVDSTQLQTSTITRN